MVRKNIVGFETFVSVLVNYQMNCCVLHKNERDIVALSRILPTPKLGMALKEEDDHFMKNDLTVSTYTLCLNKYGCVSIFQIQFSKSKKEVAKFILKNNDFLQKYQLRFIYLTVHTKRYYCNSFP